MAKDDRDYMRDRYRARAKDMRWNDRAGRVEGTWFDPKIGASTISADGFAEPDRRSAFPGQDDQCSCRGEHGLSEWDGPHASRAADRGGDGLGNSWGDRKSTRLNSSHSCAPRMPSSA